MIKKKVQNVLYVDFSQDRCMTLAEVKAYFRDQGQYEWAMDHAEIKELEDTVNEAAIFDFTMCQAYAVILRVRKHDLRGDDNVISFGRKKKKTKRKAA